MFAVAKLAFPSGEGGPHGRVVDEEIGVCTAQKISVLNNTNLFYIFNKSISIKIQFWMLCENSSLTQYVINKVIDFDQSVVIGTALRGGHTVLGCIHNTH